MCWEVHLIQLVKIQVNCALCYMAATSVEYRAQHLSQPATKTLSRIMQEPRKIRLMGKWVPAKEKHLLIFQLQGNKQDDKSAGCQTGLCGTRSQVFQPLESIEVLLCSTARAGCQLSWQTKAPGYQFCGLLRATACSLITVYRESAENPQGFGFQAKLSLFHSKGGKLQRRQADFRFA